MSSSAARLINVRLLAPTASAWCSSIAIAGGLCTPQWNTTPGQPGMDDIVHALIMHDDGAGPALYAGGHFKAAGTADVDGIARWSNGTWQAVGSGDELFGVNSLASFDDGRGPALYAAAFNLMRWDGTRWSEVPGQPGSVHSGIGVFDNGEQTELIVSGGFAMPTATGWTEYVARWNGAQWLSMDGGLNSVAHDFATFNDGRGETLIAVGSFGFFDGGFMQIGVGQWDGVTWNDVGGSTNGTGEAAVVFDDGGGAALYVGGTFSQAGQVPANRIAKWDGAQWSSLGDGIDGIGVYALAVFDDGTGAALYAGGEFSQAGGVAADNLARWDGSTWQPVSSGTNGPVHALHVIERAGTSTLVVAGDFTEAGGRPAGRIAFYGCPPIDYADLNGDGVVDGADLAILLGAWGPCADCDNCDADLDGNCTVDGADLAILLGNWG